MTPASGSSDTDARLMSWENFRTAFLEHGLAVEVPVHGQPAIDIFAEPGGLVIGLRTAVAAGTPAPKSTVDAIEVDVNDGWLRIRTSAADVFQPFYAFLLDISNRIQLDGKPPIASFNDALASWRRMLTASSILSDDQQLGLAGELWTLNRLLASQGAKALEGWIGPDRQAHDFRLPTCEIEVKTTIGELRRHIINRLDQLVPSDGVQLYILSLQMAAAGAGMGWTLADQIDALRDKILNIGGASDLLEEKLNAWGWRDTEASRYPRRRCLSSPSRLVPVDGSCPRITASTLAKSLGPLAGRIDDVHYRINVEGLGIEDGTRGFYEILPQSHEG